jgi:hypothetical protein
LPKNTVDGISEANMVANTKRASRESRESRESITKLSFLFQTGVGGGEI